MNQVCEIWMNRNSVKLEEGGDGEGTFGVEPPFPFHASQTLSSEQSDFTTLIEHSAVLRSCTAKRAI